MSTENRLHGENEAVPGPGAAPWNQNRPAPRIRRYEVVVQVHLEPRIGGQPLRKLSVSHVTKLWAEMGREG